MADFDVVGVGLNATDTMLVVPHFPAYGGKVPFLSEMYSPGGQVASAMVACAKLGLRTKYIGTIGDDEEITLISSHIPGVDQSRQLGLERLERWRGGQGDQARGVGGNP